MVCREASDAIEFYKKAFGAIELMRVWKSDKIMYAMISIEDSPIMLIDEFPKWGTLGPISLKGPPVTIHLYVEDVDSFIGRA